MPSDKEYNTLVKDVVSGLEYCFNIERKCTIVQGDSGTGKTTLIGLLGLCTQSYDKDIYVLESEYKFVEFPRVLNWDRLSSKEWEEELNISEGTNLMQVSQTHSQIVFYCDEDYAPLKLPSFQEALNEIQHNYLIVSRHPLINLVYGVEDIYEVINVGSKKHVLQQMHVDNFGFPQGNFSILKTEDEGSGKDFFAEYLIRVESARGKSKIYDTLSSVSRTLYVADSLGFGSEIKRVLGRLQRYYTNGLWLIKSFEYLLLNSSLFKGREILYLVNQYQDRNGKMGYSSIPEEISPFFFGRKEDFYEHQLRDIMCAFGETYSKYKRNLEKSEFGIGNCFIRDCCDCLNEHNKKYKEPCELYTRGDKFEIILGKELADKLRVMFGDKRKILLVTSDEESVEYEDDAESPAEFINVFK